MFCIFAENGTPLKMIFPAFFQFELMIRFLYDDTKPPNRLSKWVNEVLGIELFCLFSYIYIYIYIYIFLTIGICTAMGSIQRRLTVLQDL